MSSFPAQFGAPGWLLEPQLLDWAVAPQEQHAVLLKDWVHWLHAGSRAATLEQILFLVVVYQFFWDCHSALWIHWWQHVISCIYEVTTKRHDKKYVFLALGNRGMQTFKLLNFAQYQFLQSNRCWSTIIGSLSSLPKVKLQDFNIFTNYARQLFFIPNLLLFCSWYH
jgi:hypothetical protein